MKNILDQESNAKTYARKFAKIYAKGLGNYLYDIENNQYLDLLTSAGALPLGHNHLIYKNAVLKYIESQLPQQMLDLATPIKIEYLNEIYKWFPKEMQNYKFQLCSPAGTDAVEAALKLCRIATKRQLIVSFTGAFHGQTLGSLLCMGNNKVKNDIALPNLNSHILPFPNKYHWFDKNTDEDTMINQSLEMFRQLFIDEDCGVALPAAVILECLQGEGGMVVAPFRWIKGIREICTQYKIPLICDEIQSGWLRTGKPFAFNHSEIIPDVVTLSKSAGGGQPLAFILYNPNLDQWTPGSHSGTFRGNQLGFYTGLEVLNYVRNNLSEHINHIGQYLREKLNLLQHKYPLIIKDIRGLGLMMGIQLVDGIQPLINEMGHLYFILFSILKIILNFHTFKINLIFLFL